MIRKLQNMGPGALVSAAFIGPGTITTCTIAGATFGYSLLWALVFATLATMALQEMSARLGIVTGKGLGEVLKETFETSLLKWPLFAIILVALCVGNAAYEAGNIAGGAIGIQALFGEGDTVFTAAVLSISGIAGLLLYLGSYKQIEKLLIGLVLLMAISFISTFIIVRPDMIAFAKGLVIPAIAENSLLVIIALIGTTVVPYNLFLHASAAKTRWTTVEALPVAQQDTYIAVGLGGLITILVASTAAASLFGSGLTVTSAGDMARQIEPLFGSFSKAILGIGFFAAGLSSAIAAPLATGYVFAELTGIKGGITSYKFRAIMLVVIAIGLAVALTGIRPVEIILSAQFANGLLLPIIAAFLLVAMNNKTLLKKHINGKLSNAIGLFIVLLMVGLGIRMILKSTGYL
ncbi:Nramp family divalent metal transporter [Temperatibacter marinus]|uniref:Nramp family divalent metal transporter n=1 Tax=Temperatibacter marinus TaxID=1456591 RepID=A0AA52EKH5_9PROT|nr:Nramp family divalent metal transporter [Temperatibacter marinus]WND03899.1 Nramp family divalent metal transporter [Temperatibacter marinus]